MLGRRQVGRRAEEVVLVKSVEVVHVEEVGKIVHFCHGECRGVPRCWSFLGKQRSVSGKVVGAFTKAECSAIGVPGRSEAVA